MNDYKNTPQGKRTAAKYADIIHASRPAPARPRMDLVQRAKIFAPYDALRGFDEAIDAADEKDKEVEREELSDEEKAVLSGKLSQIRKGMDIQIRHFVPGENGRGDYVVTRGQVSSIDPVGQTLSVADRQADTTAGKIEKVLPVVIRFDDILDVEEDRSRKKLVQ